MFHINPSRNPMGSTFKICLSLTTSTANTKVLSSHRDCWNALINGLPFPRFPVCGPFFTSVKVILPKGKSDDVTPLLRTRQWFLPCSDSNLNLSRLTVGYKVQQDLAFASLHLLFHAAPRAPLALLQTHQATPALALLITWLEMLSLKVFPGLASSPHSVFLVWASPNILVTIARNRPPNTPLLPCLFPNISASNISHDLLVCCVYLFCLPG